GHEVQGVSASVVLVIGDEEFVARSKVQRTQDGIHRSGRIGNEYQVIHIRPNKSRELRASAVPQTFQVTDKELHRLPLHALADVLLKLEHRTWATAKRPVIQKSHGWIQHPECISVGVRHSLSPNRFGPL